MKEPNQPPEPTALSRLVLTHESRQPAPWLICNVRQKSMRALVVTALLAILATVHAEGATSARAEMSAKIRESFHFQPSPREVTDSDSEVVVLEKVTVVESFKRRQLEHSMQDQEKRDQRERFSWKSGGTIASKKLGAARAEVGVWSADGPFTFLRIRW